MNSFENYFSLYEATDPPPIVTEGYKLVQDNYKQYLNPQPIQVVRQIPDVQFVNQTSNSLGITTEPPKIEFMNELGDNTHLNNYSKNVKAQNVVDLARQFVGTKYQWGGMAPSTGFDCSGLVQYVYKQNGINLPRTVKDLEKVGTEVPTLADVQLGDLICTPGSGKSGKHIKIVSKIENGQIFTIDARGKKRGIIEEPLTNIDNITTIRRVLQTSYKSTKNTMKDSKYSNRTEWKQDLAQAYRDAGITNENAIRMLVAQDALESGWGKKVQGNYNYGNITAGNSWKGSVVIGNDHDSNGNPIKQRFRSYNSMDEYAKDKVSFLTRLYDFNQDDSIDTFTYKLQGGNRAGRKYAGSYSYVQGVKNVYKGLRV